MSFRFNEDVFRDNSFNQKIQEKLTSALNKAFREDTSSQTTTTADINNGSVSGAVTHSDKSDILKSRINVKKTDFPTIPKFEILDLDINTQPRSLVKGICKIIVKDAMVQLNTVIESNLLLVNMKHSPSFIKPKLIENNSLEIPIVMTFKNISLEAISNIFVKNNSISISFNDVNLDFDFDCSIKILQKTIEKRLKDSMHMVFKDVLPTVLFNMSQSWFTSNHDTASGNTGGVLAAPQSASPKTVFDEVDLQELSPKNMLRLSTIVSSRHTLSLHGTSDLNSMASIPGCLEKQNLYRFISRMPSLSNYYSAYRRKEATPNANGENSSQQNEAFQYSHDDNCLPERVLREKQYDLNQILDIQNKLYERSTVDENEKPRRRVIKLGKKHKKKTESSQNPMVKSASESQNRQTTPTFEQINFPKTAGAPEVCSTPKCEVNAVHSAPAQVDYFSHDIPEIAEKSFNDKITVARDELNKRLSSKHADFNDISLTRNARINSIGSPPKRISFVGINNYYNSNGWKWGNEDHTTVLPPPPYKV
ncbi:ERMES complex subunit [Maudiozyma humilis]|uniref:ERMES complex subunit n=1 Tax=Maudiozyma humilis TaxID=51915 RepID=A0AAV5RSW5_MAUHU|nr:ERMES complex subunit [Kazachstania humilis]